MSDVLPPSGPSAIAEKAVLLCEHAEELSAQCQAGIRRSSLEGVSEAQARKNTVVEELVAIAARLDLEQFPNLQRAIGRLREALQAEMSLLTGAVGDLQNELLTVSAAQRRLAQARHYEKTTAQSLLAAGGDHFSVCG